MATAISAAGLDSSAYTHCSAEHQGGLLSFCNQGRNRRSTRRKNDQTGANGGSVRTVILLAAIAMLCAVGLLLYGGVALAERLVLARYGHR